MTPDDVDDVVKGLAEHEYLADEGLATSIFLALRLRRPLLLEGEAGVGKTEVAKVLSRWTGGELVRLQCYEGIDASQAVYEWDYSRQLLHLRAVEASHERVDEDELYSERFLVKRPLLRAIASGTAVPPVLLIDEVDRADDEFEAFLLEILSDWSITVPELGVMRADGPARRRADLEPHARRPRRIEAPLPLPLDPASRLRTGAGDRACTRAARGGRAGARRCRRDGGIARHGSVQAAGCGGDDRLGGGARDTWRRPARRDDDRRHARDDLEVPGGPGARPNLRARPNWCARRSRAVPEPLAADGAERLAVAFARVLRGAGVDVPVGATLAFADALATVGLASRAGVYWSGRATLVTGPEQVETYDKAFRAFWDRTQSPAALVDTPPTEVVVALDVPDDTAAEPDVEPVTADTPVLSVRWSRQEVLRQRDFADYTPAEFVEARRLMNDLRLAGAMRRSRRRRPSRHRRGDPDLRRTVRRSLRAGGEPVVRAFLEPGERTRRLVLLLDVSGSMEPYARAFVRFLHAAVVGRGRVEAFALGTRLTRVTRELTSRDPDVAVRGAARRVADWSGGTRLGEGLRAFNDRWGVRGMARGAVVVVFSDGWDRGEPEVLAEQMARLSRIAYRVVWVNPLKATPGYAPLAQGMAAALPYVDEFVEGHSLAALEELTEVIAR